MEEQQPSLPDVIAQHLAQGDNSGWFEPVYASAEGNAECIPWAGTGPRQDVLAWQQKRHPVGKGDAALVIGCGLGGDAEFLAGRGYQVTAFDISPTAIAWCKRTFPQSTVDYQVADIFAPPEAWRGGFDLVLEDYIVQALPPAMRQEAINAVAAFVAPGGLLLAIGQGIDDVALRAGPPWPLTQEELALFVEAGLVRGDIEKDDDPTLVPKYRYWAEFRRPA